MSTITLAASTPDASSDPCRTIALDLPVAAARVQVFALLERGRHFEDPERGRGHAAVGSHLDLRAVLSEHRVAMGVGEDSLRGGRELPVARVADALGGLHGKEAGAGDREVERFACFLQRRRRHVGVRLAQRHALVNRADRGAALGVGEQDLAEVALGRAVGLVARGRAVSEVVRELALARLLGDHARGSDVETEVHLHRVFGRD